MTDASIIKQLGLSELTLSAQEEMLLTLSDLIFRGALGRVIERMDSNDRDDFAGAMEKDDTGEAVAAFLKERVPNADEAVRETVDELAADMAALDIPGSA